MRYYRITPQGEFELSEEIGEAQFHTLVGDREPDETADFSAVKKLKGDDFCAAHMLGRLGTQGRRLDRVLIQRGTKHWPLS
jgi:hypothetical protein